MTPKGSSRTAQGASPGFKVEIAESPERAAQGFGFQLQINAGHKAPHLIAAPLHRPFGASVVALLVPRACALGFPEPPLIVVLQPALWAAEPQPRIDPRAASREPRKRDEDLHETDKLATRWGRG